MIIKGLKKKDGSFAESGRLSLQKALTSKKPTKRRFTKSDAEYADSLIRKSFFTPNTKKPTKE